nr:hypothetical protein [Tanacetum cinerariifolium]
MSVDQVVSYETILEAGGGDQELRRNRQDSLSKLRQLENEDMLDAMQKAKVKWGVEADENSKFFHGIINRKRRQLAINGIMKEGCNSSFITLIPKVANALVVSNFWLISLIGAQYKVIAKILANHLSQVIATVISSEQTAFVSQRQILDGPLMVNEIIDCTGFGQTWRSRIQGCLTSAKASILVNGSPTIEPNLQRGLWQGLYCGAKLHFLYVSHFLRMMCFCLKLNLHKSNLYGVGVDLTEVSNLALVTGCQAQCLPFSYLGLPVGSNMARINSWVPIIDKFKKRLPRWKSSLLSIGGRSTLITSVLGSLEEALKIPWIAWKSGIAPKSQGGMGIGSLTRLI